jgi:hypothetical protein
VIPIQSNNGWEICDSCLFRDGASGICEMCEDGDQYEHDFDVDPDEEEGDDEFALPQELLEAA